MTINTGHARFIRALLLAWKDEHSGKIALPTYRDLGKMLALIEGNPKDISTSVIGYAMDSIPGLHVDLISDKQKRVYTLSLAEGLEREIRDTDEYRKAREAIRARHT